MLQCDVYLIFFFIILFFLLRLIIHSDFSFEIHSKCIFDASMFLLNGKEKKYIFIYFLCCLESPVKNRFSISKQSKLNCQSIVVFLFNIFEGKKSISTL